MNFNQRTNTLIYKNMYLSHFILERVDVSVVCERWVERHILRERTSSSHIFLPTLAPRCKFVRDAPDWLRVPRSTPILCTLSKSDCMALITRSPSGYTPVVPERPDRAAVY